MEEIFVKIDNVHIVSNKGRVYSEYSKSFIGAWDEAVGRYCVIYNKNLTPIHILVAKAFPEICGEWFEGCNVHHKDGNPLNNKADNLLVLTAQEHLSLHNKGKSNPNYGNHNKKPNISKALKGKRKPYKHKQIIQYTLDGTFVKEWECIADIHTELGYSIGNICMCCQGKLKTAYKYLWRYKNNGDSVEPPIS